jgi:NAD(P)H-nitrite reductase large subunit
MRYLIIGGGVAGTTAAETLRKLDSESEITLVSEEQHSLYSRVLLPFFIKGKIPRERVFLKKESWYAEQKIEWLRGVRVEKLDIQNQFVLLFTGQEIEYDKLLIATGGEVRSIDSDLRGVSYFRTLNDADHILQLLREQTGDARGAVYGGGFIACEFINLFRHFDMPIIVAYRGEHFWTSLLGEEAGKLIHNHLVKEGVEVLPNSELKGLAGEKDIKGFATVGGEHVCSCLGIGIGIESDLGWLTDAGIEIGRGVKANAYLETNIPNVYTAGDVAEFFDPIIGRQLIVGNWMNSMSQGRTVAHTMSGERTAFELVSSYATNALGLEMIFVGDVEKDAADKVHIVGSVESGGVTQIHERDGRVVGGVMIGRNTDRKAITDGIKEKHSVEEVLAIVR